MALSGNPCYLPSHRNVFLYFIVNLQTAVYMAGLCIGIAGTSGILFYQPKKGRCLNKIKDIKDSGLSI